MENLVFVKLGGSLITDKQERFRLRADTVRRLAEEIGRARAADPSLRLLLGHGSGSFGHVAARESGYDTESGHPSIEALTQVGAAASELNHLVRSALLDAGVPVLSVPPSVSARLRDGRVVEMAAGLFADLLARGIVPLTYGDVALNVGEGSAIASTEALFLYLAGALQPQRLIILGLVDGVYERPPVAGEPLPPLLRTITPQEWAEVRAGMGGSHGTDVTGGMRAKVAEMLEIVRRIPSLHIRIASGEKAGLLEQLLLDPALEAGTLIHSGSASE